MFIDDLADLLSFLNATNGTDDISAGINQSAFEFGESGIFIELYLGDSPSIYNTSLCTLSNSDNSSWLSLEDISPSGNPYFVINTTGVFHLEKIDGVGLFCNKTMIDYVAWGQDGVGPNGTVHDMAVESGHWLNGTVVETLYSVDYEQEYTILTNSSIPTNASNASFGITLQQPSLLDPSLLTRPIVPGDSIGRNRNEDDTNSPSDFSVLGGIDNTGPSPGEKNENTYLSWLSSDCLYTDTCFSPYTMSRRDLHRSSGDRFASGEQTFTQAERDRFEQKDLDTDPMERRHLDDPGRKWTIIMLMDPSDPKVSDWL